VSSISLNSLQALHSEKSMFWIYIVASSA